jgi:hypothetical protein
VHSSQAGNRVGQIRRTTLAHPYPSMRRQSQRKTLYTNLSNKATSQDKSKTMHEHPTTQTCTQATKASKSLSLRAQFWRGPSISLVRTSLPLMLGPQTSLRITVKGQQTTTKNEGIDEGCGRGNEQDTTNRALRQLCSSQWRNVAFKGLMTPLTNMCVAGPRHSSLVIEGDVSVTLVAFISRFGKPCLLRIFSTDLGLWLPAVHTPTKYAPILGFSSHL